VAEKLSQFKVRDKLVPACTLICSENTDVQISENPTQYSSVGYSKSSNHFKAPSAQAELKM